MCTVSVGCARERRATPSRARRHGVQGRHNLEVKLGSVEETDDAALFKGEIVSGRAHVPGRRRRDGRARVRPLAPHDALAQQRTFLNQTISDIVDEHRQTTAASASAPSTAGLRSTSSSSDNESDWEFIWRLAKRIGFEFTIDDTRGEFKKPNPNAKAVELTYRPTTSTPPPHHAPSSRSRRSRCAASTSRRSRRSREKTAAEAAQVTQAGSSAPTSSRPSPAPRWRSPASRSRPRARPRRWRRSCSTSSPTPTSPPRARATATPGSRRACKLEVEGVGGRFSGTYRVAKAVHCDLRAAAATRRRSRTGRRAHAPRPGRRRNGGGDVGRLDRGRHRDRRQRSRQLGRVKVKFPI